MAGRLRQAVDSAVGQSFGERAAYPHEYRTWVKVINGAAIAATDRQRPSIGQYSNSKKTFRTSTTFTILGIFYAPCTKRYLDVSLSQVVIVIISVKNALFLARTLFFFLRPVIRSRAVWAPVREIPLNPILTRHLVDCSADFTQQP